MNGAALAKHYSTLSALVVDAIPEIRLAIKKMVAEFGVGKVDTASHGEEAIAKCSNKQYDIILIDYNLGEKKSGQQVLEELRHVKMLGYQSIYILVTAETTRSKVYGAIENQPDAYLAKPFAPAALRSRLDALVKNRVELAEIYKAADAGDMEAAISACEKRIALNDKYLTACLKIQGTFLFQLKKFSQAEKVYRQVMQDKPFPWAQIGLANALLAQNKMNKAEPILQQMVENETPFLEAYDSLAEIQIRRGGLTQSQAIIEKATQLSPGSILRQRHLAEISEQNADYPGAEKAFKNALKSSYHSVYEKPKSYIQCIHSINKVVIEAGEPDKKRFDEVEQIIARMERRYKGDTGIKIQAKILMAETIRIHGREETAKKSFEEAEVLYEQNLGDDLSVDVALEYAKALSAQGNENKAIEVLKESAFRHSDDTEALRAIDSCLSEPVSEQGKKELLEFNRQGKVLFENLDFSGAVEFFAKALRLYPDHITLNLNIAMAIVKSFKSSPGQPESLRERLYTVLSKLENIPQDDKHYALYCSVKKQAESL